MNNEYYYKLQYVDGDKVVTHQFPADIGGYELMNNLRDFLCGCSWTEDSVKEILNIGEEE